MAIVFFKPVVLIVTIYFLYLNNLSNLFVNEEPNNRDYIIFFEHGTKTKFPKSGRIVKKEYFGEVLTDGWQTAIINVDDRNEFKFLKEDIINGGYLKIRKKDSKATTFILSLGAKVTLDSVFYNKKNEFKLVFDNETKQILFEKRW